MDDGKFARRKLQPPDPNENDQLQIVRYAYTHTHQIYVHLWGDQEARWKSSRSALRISLNDAYECAWLCLCTFSLHLLVVEYYLFELNISELHKSLWYFTPTAGRLVDRSFAFSLACYAREHARTPLLQSHHRYDDEEDDDDDDDAQRRVRGRDSRSGNGILCERLCVLADVIPIILHRLYDYCYFFIYRFSAYFAYYMCVWYFAHPV